MGLDMNFRRAWWKFFTLMTPVFLMALPTKGVANPYERNGFPCIQEICIGDGLDQLRRIQWDRAEVQLPDGSPTEVTIMLMPTEKPNVQRWSITSIAQRIPPVTTEEQFQEVGRQIRGRYRAFEVRTNTRNLRPGEAGMMVSAEMPLVFVLKLMPPDRLRDLLRRYPTCGMD